MSNGFPSIRHGIASLLVQTLDGLTALRPRALKIGANMTLVNNADGTATIAATGGGGGGSVATSNEATIFNDNGITLTAGLPVYDAGQNDFAGQPITVGRCAAGQNNIVLGCVKEDIPDNSNGTVVTFGLLEHIDTTEYSDFDELFIDLGTGNVSTSPPSGEQTTRYAIVIAAGSADGSIFVLPQPWNGTYKHDHREGAQGGGLSTALFLETAEPGNPPSGYQYVWVDSTSHTLKAKTSAGVVRSIG